MTLNKHIPEEEKFHKSVLFYLRLPGQVLHFKDDSGRVVKSLLFRPDHKYEVAWGEVMNCAYAVRTSDSGIVDLTLAILPTGSLGLVTDLKNHELGGRLSTLPDGVKILGKYKNHNHAWVYLFNYPVVGTYGGVFRQKVSILVGFECPSAIRVERDNMYLFYTWSNGLWTLAGCSGATLGDKVFYTGTSEVGGLLEKVASLVKEGNVSLVLDQNGIQAKIDDVLVAADRKDYVKVLKVLEKKLEPSNSAQEMDRLKDELHKTRQRVSELEAKKASAAFLVDLHAKSVLRLSDELANASGRLVWIEKSLALLEGTALVDHCINTKAKPDVSKPPIEKSPIQPPEAEKEGDIDPYLVMISNIPHSHLYDNQTFPTGVGQAVHSGVSQTGAKRYDILGNYQGTW